MPGGLPNFRSDLFKTTIVLLKLECSKNGLKSRFSGCRTTILRSDSSAFLKANLIPFFSISFLDSLIPAVSETITG